MRHRLPDPVSRLEQALTDIAGAPVALERPGDADHGDYATNVALRLAPTRGRPPRDLATEIAEQAVQRGLVSAAEPAGPGFVNLRVSDQWLAEAVSEIVGTGSAFG
ncbi:MAG: Arginyl-tRNA synthetase, partial [Thermoleophilia bacterium]|nr:Arginyl-tRNA synthetase [Thermoleophilia bacterium]